jgi:glyoxylase-like metal-dependent hydrolase (beta-lactamase superfamily II)
MVLHTPGHVPDELAVWDDAEKMLYVSDTLYEYEPIIFPKEGSIVTWFATLDYLISFVQSQSHTVRINSGHRTVLRPALDVLFAAKSFMVDVVSGREKIRRRTIQRGENTVEYRQTGGRFALICPERLVLQARESSLV